MQSQPTTTRTMTSRKGGARTAALGITTLLILPTLAGAQTTDQAAGLEEVIVTAQKREENLQETAVAVTAVSADTLANVNADTFYDIARVAPSVQMGGLNANQLVIRGVGQQQPGLFSEQGAAIYVDGIYRPRFSLNSINFSNVERMEVLRGPQGTLYGKNAVGGAVNIITKSAGNDFGGDMQAQFGSRKHTKLDTSINLPLVQDKLSARLSYNYNKQDGYIDDVYTGDKLSDTNYYAVHGSLRWSATENFEAILHADYFHQDQKGLAYVLLQANRVPTAAFAARDAIVNSYVSSALYKNNAGPNTFNLVDEKGTSLTLDWRLGPGSFKSITAYRKHDNRTNADADGTPLVVRSNPSDLFEHFFSEELQYNLAAFDDKLNWTSGAFYYNEKGNNDGLNRDNNDVLAGTPTRTSTVRFQDATSYAAFSQATYTAFENLGITLGARYSVEKKDVTAQSFNDNTGAKTADVSGSDDWKSFTPKLTVQYQFTPDLMSYATVSRGFKAGGYNTSTSAFLPFDPEYLWNYELGLKSEWFERRLRANLTAYQMDYNGIQLNQIVVVDASTGQTSPLVTNSGDARIRGGEAELTWAAMQNLIFNAGFGVNDFQYRSLKPGSQVTMSNVLPNSPKYSATTGLEYSFNLATGKLALRSDYSYRSKTYFDATNVELTAQGAYGLYSARITYSRTDSNWSAYAYGNNLADKYFRAAGFAGAGISAVLPGPPREIGAGFRLGFGR